jgi:hypothetical protein
MMGVFKDIKTFIWSVNDVCGVTFKKRIQEKNATQLVFLIA